MNQRPVQRAPRGGRRPALALALGLAVATGCQRTPPPSVTRVKIDAALREAVAEVGIEGTAVEAIARAALTEAGFRLQAATARAFEARVDVVTLRIAPLGGEDGLQAELAVEVELAPVQGDEPPHKEIGRAVERIGPGGPALAVRTALTAAVGEAIRALRVSVAADVKTSEALIADLSSADERVRAQAVQSLGDRGVKAAVPALVERLRDGDSKVAHRAVGALAQIKDPRAVPALIDLARGGDPTLTMRMARIVGDIGGRDAQGWLLVLESAHPDPRVREAAGAILDEVRRAAPPEAAARSAARK